MNQASEPETTLGMASGEAKTESKQSKPGRGGKRPGSGRKPDLMKRMIGSLKPRTARELLEIVPVEKTILEIFERGSLALKYRALADLMDRAWGKPAHSVNVAGSMVHAVWRPLEKLGFTDDELAIMHKARMKLDGAQDGPQNQIESKPAIEAEVVESDASNT